MRRFLPHVTAAALLALFVMALFYRLLFTDRVMASGDILLYFYPYQDFASAALRAGEIPLWNPYIFSGAPFLANSQAAVLYPLHWPLSWLPVTGQIYGSAAIHTWILGLGGYALLRRWGYGWLPGMVTGLTLAGSGFYGGLLGHINQMNGAAWLPWMVLLGTGDWGLGIGNRGSGTGDRGSGTGSLELKPQATNIQYLIPNTALFALLVALTLLAGHTQTAYINLFGVGVWIVVRGLVTGDWGLGIRRFGGWAIGKIRRASCEQSSVPSSWFRQILRQAQEGPQPASPVPAPRSPIPNPQSPIPSIQYLIPNLLIYAAGVALGLLLSAAQLLPTVELSGLGLRSGGLSYGEATSFSLHPLRLPWTIFPSYGLVDLSVIFGPAFTEFVGYIGTIPLLLALFALWCRRGGSAWIFGLLFAGLGIFLALGRWNPVYYLLYQIVPGFDLFRTPARWMMLYTLGMAVLAGIGIGDRGSGIGDRARQLISRVQISVFSGQFPVPSPQSPIPDPRSLILLLITVDLLLAARALPHTRPTAPQAVYDVRTAPAHLLTDPARTLHPAAMGRFLSLSTIEFDPGDMADWRRIYRGDPPQLEEAAFWELIIALKAQEILAPNLPLLWRVPAVDGFDGGVLPLQRYNQFMALLIPADQLVPDGRIREQLSEIPAADRLRLLNARYIITDKVRDLWFQGIYYDRQIGATVRPSAPQVEIEAPHSFEATTVALIGFVDRADAQNQIVARLEVIADGAVIESIPLTAGGEPGAHFADGALGSPGAESAGATVAFVDVDRGRQEYLAALPLERPLTPDRLRIVQEGDTALIIQAVTLVDERTGTFQPLLPSDRGAFRLVHSGDVKIYEATEIGGRAYLASAVERVSSPADALTVLQQGIAAGRAVVEAPVSVNLAAAEGEAEIVEYSAERVVVRTVSAADSFLVLSDAYYPGWEATVDGVPAPIYPTNILFRGVPVPAGEHDVVFTFRPQSWQRGRILSALGILVWLGLLVVGVWRRRR